MEAKFCSFCGSPLATGSKFCSQCGKSVLVQEEEQKSKENQAPSRIQNDTGPNSSSLSPEAMCTIKIGKYNLLVAESVIAYNEFRTHFVNYAEQSQLDYISFYDKEVSDFESLYNNGIPEYIDAATKTIDFAVSVLSRYGVSISSDEFFQQAKQRIDFTEDLRQYAEIADRFMEFVEQLQSYRASERTGGAHWQGGGFGLSGAIKGALMAGGLNLATDAVRGIGHMVQGSADRARLKKLQIDLYNERDHKKYLSECLYRLCIELFYPATRLLEERGLLRHPPFDSAAGIGPIMAGFDLLNGQESPSKADYEEALKLTLQGMPYDPYNGISYLTLYKIPFLDKKDVLKTVRFFGVEEQFSAKVMEFEQDALAEFNRMPDDTIEAIDQKLLKAKELNRSFCYTKISPQELTKKKKELQSFQAIKELPEASLTEAQSKYDKLTALSKMPEITAEVKRLAALIAKFEEKEQKEKEWSDFLLAFSEVNLNVHSIAKELLENSVFQAYYGGLTRDLSETKDLLDRVYFHGNKDYHIIASEELSLIGSMTLFLKSEFAPYTQTEIPIIYISGFNTATFLRTVAYGMLISNQKLYIKGDSDDSPARIIPLNEVKTIIASKRVSSSSIAWKISANDSSSFVVYEEGFLKRVNCEQLVEILFFIKNYCLFLAATQKQSSKSLFLDVLNAANITQEEFEQTHHISSQAEIDRIKSETEVARSVITTYTEQKESKEALQAAEQQILKEVMHESSIYCYVLERYYSDLIDSVPFDGKNHFEAVKLIIQNLKIIKNKHPFFGYLENYLWLQCYDRHSRDSSAYVSQVCKFADQGIPSAMAMKGFWATNGYKNLKNMVDEGITLLKKAAAADEPTAMAQLGNYYRTGACGLQIDLAKARELLRRAAAYGHPNAVKELSALDKDGIGSPPVSTTQSSGCFITSAVCRTLNKPDDCYELSAFRAFRDQWLHNQPGGKELIAEYYQIAPKIVSAIDTRPDSQIIYHSILEKYLTPCLRYIETKQYEECKETYIEMVNNLRKQYQ